MGGRMSRPPGVGGEGAAKSEETEPLLPGDVSPPRRRPGYWPSADDLRVFAIIVVEMSLSIGLNFYNSYLLKHVPGFNFPLIYTAVHMLTSFIGASVLISCFGAATVGWSELRAHLPQVGPPCCFPRFLAASPDRLHYPATASCRRASRPCS